MEPQNPTFPTPPPQVTPPTVSPVFPKKNNLVVILLSIFLLITLLISGYLFLQVQSLTKKLAQLQVQPTPTPLSTEIPSPTPDPTANWKTYTDAKYGFSLKYPDTYFKFQGDLALGFFVATSATQGGNGPKFLPNHSDVWLGASSIENANIQTLDQYLVSQQNYYNNAIKTPTTMDGVSAYKVIYNAQVYCAGSSCTTSYNYDGLALKNGNLYTISLSSLDQAALDADATLFDQILSTFRFLK